MRVLSRLAPVRLVRPVRFPDCRCARGRADRRAHAAHSPMSRRRRSPSSTPATSGPAPKQGGVAVRLSSPRGEESFPRFSPDGKTLAVAASAPPGTCPSTRWSGGDTGVSGSIRRDRCCARPLPSGLVISWSGHARHRFARGGAGAAAGFPYRNLIVLTAFAVVLGTLVIQGLTLKPLLRALICATMIRSAATGGRARARAAGGPRELRA